MKGKKRLTPTKEEIRADELYEHPRCRNCGRKLYSIKSIKRGYGDRCGLYFAEKYIHAHPTYLSPRAKKVWSKEEIVGLIKAVKKGIVEGGGER